MNLFKNNKIILFIFFVLSSINAQESIFEKKNIAQTYLEEGLYEDAIIIYEDILVLQIEILGQYNLALVQTLYSLSDAYLLNNDIEDSKNFLKQALDIQYYNFIINQKKYIPTFEKLKDLYSIHNDTNMIKEIDSLSLILSNIHNDTLFFAHDTLNFFPDLISIAPILIDSTNLVSEYSVNDKAIDYMDMGLMYLNMGVYSETVKNFDLALQLNANIIDKDYLLNINFGDSISQDNLYNTFYEIENFDSTITSSAMFLGLIELSKNKNTELSIHYFEQYSDLNPLDIKPYLLIGDIYFQKNEFIDAMIFYLKALLINENHLHANLYMGKSLLSLGEYWDSIEKLNFFIEIDSNNFEARESLGIGYYMIGDYANAINQLTEALLLNDGNYNTYHFLGMSYNKINKKQQALESFQKSIQLNNENGEAYFEIGLIYESILKLEEAIINYKLAKKYIDNNDILNINVGTLLYHQEDYHEALSPLRQYIINNPYNVKILEMLGEIFIQENRYSEAIDTYERLLDVIPNNEKYYLYIAESYLILENYIQAKIYYKEVLSFNEERAEILLELGKISNILKQYMEAEEYFLEAIYCNFKNKELLFQLGLSYGGQKKYLQALEAFKEALNYSLDDPILHYQLAIVFKELEIYDLAIQEFRKYLRDNKNDAVVHRMIGECYFYLNDFHNSTNYLLKASNLYDNSDMFTYYYLGLAAMQNNQEWDAAKYFKHALRLNPDHPLTHFKLIDVYLILNKKREANRECDILYMLDRELYYSAKFCNQ